MSPTKILVLALLWCCAGALAQTGTAPFSSVNLYKVANEEGLSQVSVNTLFKDSEGFLWIGTDDGLNRYDGMEVVRYYSRYDDLATMAANEVYAITEDKGGRIWLAHYNAGISIFDKKKNSFQRLGTGNNRLSSNWVYGLYCDAQGRIIARTIEGLSIIDPHTLKVQNLVHPAFHDEDITNHIDIVEGGGYYWFGSKKRGLLQAAPGGALPLPTAWDGTRYGHSVSGITKVSDRELMVLSEKGLFRVLVQPTSYTVYPIIEDPVRFIAATKALRYGNTPYVWVATDQQGIFIIDIAQKKVVKELKSALARDNLLSNGVNYLLQDSERNVFIATGRGVNIYSPYSSMINNYENTFRKIPNFGHPVYALHELPDGNLLIGTKRGGAYFFNTGTGEVQSLPYPSSVKGPAKPSIYQFTPVSGEEFLVSTARGIFTLRRYPGGFRFVPNRFKELDRFASLEITNVVFGRDSLAWISSFTDGLYRWNHKKGTIRAYHQNKEQPSKGPVDDQIQKIITTREGDLILCTQYGFSIFYPAKDSFVNFLPGKNYPYELPARNIKYAYDDGPYIWITTYGAGVQRWDKKRKIFTGYTTANGLPNDAVYSILPDDIGRLWIATNNGLAVLDKKRGSTRVFTTEDGLPENEFNGHASYRSRSGKLFYSTLNGIVSITPGADLLNTYTPNIVLTHLAASNGKRDTTLNTYRHQTYRLPAGYSSMDIKFAALSFAAPRKNQYQIRLEGFDPRWISTANKGSFHYSGLQPGTYRLRIKAANNSGIWSRNELAVKIIVLPFWHQTFLFRFLVVLTLAGFLYWIIRTYYNNRLKDQKRGYEQQLAIQQERQRISSEIHDDIGAGLSGIRLLTEITRKKLHNSDVEGEVQQIHSSVNELSGKMREVIWSLNTENDNLENLLYYIKRSAHKLFEHSATALSVRLPEEIPAVEVAGETRRHIHLAVKEALHNSLKHAEATECCLIMDVQAGVLHIRVADNGKGLAANKGSGNGLRNMQKRLKQVGGTLQVESEAGTTVTFSIPLTPTTWPS